MPEKEIKKLEDIKETKDVVVFLAKVGVSMAQCALGKQFKLSYFMDDLLVAPEAVRGITKVWGEIKDIDLEEGGELLGAVMLELAPLGISDRAAAMHYVKAGKYFIMGIISTVEGVKAKKAE